MKKSLLLLFGLTFFQTALFSQDAVIPVNGTVIDQENGMPVAGANVVEKGTANGVLTNFDGEFKIEVPSNATLVVSYVGYSTSEIKVAGQTTLAVSLKTEVSELDEVVVVGYGSQKKATLTGAIATVETKKVRSSPAISVSNSLTGLLPGLTALNSSGQPGKNVSTILIRGQSTTGDNSPLVVVDGVPDETDAWKRINQNDIEQLSVLKDASAAIYGARAANGVILITTKRGTVGKPTVNYSYNQGFVVPTRLPEMADSWDWANYVNEFRVNFQNLDPLYTPQEIQIMRDGSDPINYPNTDWPHTVFSDYSLQSKHNISIRGGSESVRYSVSGSYAAENSMVRNGLHEYDGYTLRANIDADITDNFTFGLDWNGLIDDVVEPEIDNYGFETSPINPAYYPNGLPASTVSDNNYNPALNLTGAGGYISDKVQRNRIKLSFGYDVPQIEGLGMTGFYAYTNETTENKQWRETWDVYNYDNDSGEYVARQGGRVNKPDLRQRFIKFEEKLVNFRLTYDRMFGKHNLGGFVGFEQSEGSMNSFEAYRRDFLSGAIEELFAGGGENQEATGTRRETSRRNLIGRLSWNFQDKYLLDFNARYDGSYAFPKGKRWGFFPGLSVAWNLTQEKFMQDLKFINYLKLRGSYGEMGNDKISPFQFLELNSLDPIGTHFGGGVQGIVKPGVAPNPNITWEVAKTTNFGLDAFFLDSRLGFSLDVFKQKRENILTPRTTEIPNYTGLILPDENVGVIENKGLETSLTIKNNTTNDFSYSVSGNFAYAKNKILELSEPQDLLVYQKAEGSVIGAPLLYNSIGIFRTQEEVDSNPVMAGTRVGDLRYEDINDDGTIDAADRIRVNKGPVPEITFGLNTTFGYKNFSLFANFAGQAKASLYIYQTGRPIYNILQEVYDNRYIPGSTDSKYPIMPQESSPGEGEVNGALSTFWFQDATFLRLQTLQLSYTIPADFLTKLGLSAAEVYVNGNNLFTLSKIKWYDPAGNTDNSGEGGIDVQYSTGEFYPQTKIFNLGANISF